MADGWAVEVTTQGLSGGETKQIFYAHIPDKIAAEEAVKHHISASADVKVIAREPTPHNAFVSAGIAEGQIGQWP